MRIFLFALLSLSALKAQIRPNLMEEAGKDNLPSQKLGADDLVAVSVYDAPELTRTVRVEADGTIHLPLLKRGVPAAGEFPRTLEASIANALTSEQILVDPVVKVTVVEYHSRPISVIGAVKKPLTFQSVGSVTVVDALARAEGMTADAGTEILLSIRQHRRRRHRRLWRRGPSGAHLRQAPPQRRRPLRQLHSPRRRRNPRPRSEPHFCRRQCEEARRLPCARRGRHVGPPPGCSVGRPAAVLRQTCLYLPARCRRREARNPSRAGKNPPAKIA